MATFLLRADDAEMAAWKADAKRRGRSFVEHLRILARASSASQPVGFPAPTRADVTPHPGDLVAPAVHERAARDLASFRPDPKR